MDEIRTPRQLTEAYAYQFAKPVDPWAFSIARGWLPIVARACADIDALVRDDRFQYRFHWLQIKQKFGTLRLYWKARGMQGVRVDLVTPAGVLSAASVPDGKGRDGLVATRIAQIVRSAEAESASTCMACGTAARLRQGDWLLTLCDEHAQQKQLGTELQLWFASEESAGRGGR